MENNKFKAVNGTTGEISEFAIVEPYLTMDGELSGNSRAYRTSDLTKKGKPDRRSRGALIRTYFSDRWGSPGYMVIDPAREAKAEPLRARAKELREQLDAVREQLNAVYGKPT